MTTADLILNLSLSPREKNSKQAPTQKEADALIMLFSPGEKFTTDQFKDALGMSRYAVALAFLKDACGRGLVSPFLTAELKPGYSGPWMRPERKK